MTTLIIFWLAVLSAYLGWRVYILKRALRTSREWQERAMHAVVKAFSLQGHEAQEDRVLDSEVIE